MDIDKIAKEKFPDLDLRPFVDQNGFIQNESPYWQMNEKRTAQRMAWIEGVKWCASQNASTNHSALPTSDVVGSLPTDEDIEEAASNYLENKIYVSNSEKHDNCRQWGFEAGAEWMREKVSGQ